MNRREFFKWMFIGAASLVYPWLQKGGNGILRSEDYFHVYPDGDGLLVPYRFLDSVIAQRGIRDETEWTIWVAYNHGKYMKAHTYHRATPERVKFKRELINPAEKVGIRFVHSNSPTYLTWFSEEIKRRTRLSLHNFTV